MINVSPVGRNASLQERQDFEKYDKEHQIRAKFVEALREKFADFSLTYAPLPLPTYPLPTYPPTHLANPSLLSFTIDFPSAAKSPSTSSPPAGIRHTAYNI